MRRAQKPTPLVEMLDEFEEQIQLLKVKYERYFNGVDRFPPVKDREAVDRLARNIMRQHFRTTALRYRFAQLKQRFTTYQHYWNRILSQIEKGTFKRVVAEAERRQRQAMQAAREARARGGEAEGTPTNGRPAASPSGQKVALPDGLQAREARDLFKKFVQAKKAAGENVKGITYGGLVQKLARELPKLQAKHGRDVSFEVTTVNGKVKLRARGR